MTKHILCVETVYLEVLAVVRHHDAGLVLLGALLLRHLGSQHCAVGQNRALCSGQYRIRYPKIIKCQKLLIKKDQKI